VLAATATAVASISLAGCGGQSTSAPRSSAAAARRAPVEFRGRSVQGRPIVAREVAGSTPGGTTVLVVGCIDGNERAGIAVVKRLRMVAPPAGVSLWTVPVLNPDGAHADTRVNADGVDLNRNFPYDWRRLGVRGSPEYSGPHALSEPEARFAHRLILHLRSSVTIWFHQPEDVVDESGGNPAIERRFARLAHLPFGRLPRYPGSAASWQDHHLAGSTAFVVELPPGPPSRAEIQRWAAAVVSLARSIIPHAAALDIDRGAAA
jgi:protein MpaA